MGKTTIIIGIEKGREKGRNVRDLVGKNLAVIVVVGNNLTSIVQTKELGLVNN